MSDYVALTELHNRAYIFVIIFNYITLVSKNQYLYFELLLRGNRKYYVFIWHICIGAGIFGSRKLVYGSRAA